MRVPRIRFTVWWMMVVVAVVALSLGYLRRPYPVTTTLILTKKESRLTHYEIRQRWSDGQVQRIKAQCSLAQPNIINASEPWPKGWLHYGPILRVEWSDGSTSYYLDDDNGDE